jgi:hypothetical protein
VPNEFNLGKYSIPMGWISVIWMVFMVITLCLPQVQPITINNMNYSPIALGIVLVLAFLSWMLSARKWFKGYFLLPFFHFFCYVILFRSTFTFFLQVYRTSLTVYDDSSFLRYLQE